MLRHLAPAGFLLLAACNTPVPLLERASTAILPEAVVEDLRPGEGDFSPDLVYITDAAETRRNDFDKVMLDPIIFYLPPQQTRSLKPDDRQTLLNNFQVLMARALEKDYLLALEPQRGTVRVQFAVLPSTTDPVAMDTVAMVAREDPDKHVVTDAIASPLTPGADLLVEALWTDAVTGEVLGATVDRHFGQVKFDGQALKSWGDVNRYLEGYAELIRFRLCRFRGRTDCTAPPASLS